LLRAADLIGQLADPFYPRKLNALYYEFYEIGCHAQLGYASPADVADQYPRFFWSKVEPFIGDALSYLELTVEGRQWMANLYCNVFEIEHGRRRMGLTTYEHERGPGHPGTTAKVLRGKPQVRVLNLVFARSVGYGRTSRLDTLLMPASELRTGAV
jgi:hypothetical protein